MLIQSPGRMKGPPWTQMNRLTASIKHVPYCSVPITVHINEGICWYENAQGERQARLCDRVHPPHSAFSLEELFTADSAWNYAKSNRLSLKFLANIVRTLVFDRFVMKTTQAGQLRINVFRWKGKGSMKQEQLIAHHSDFWQHKHMYNVITKKWNGLFCKETIYLEEKLCMFFYGNDLHKLFFLMVFSGPIILLMIKDRFPLQKDIVKVIKTVSGSFLQLLSLD